MRFLLFLPLLFLGCKEIEPVIGPLGPGSVEGRNVLVEEYTGVTCVNCPPGATELAGLQALYGDKLIIVGIHAGDFSKPTPLNQFDFRTEDGTNLFNFLGSPEGYPAAIVNRKAIGNNPLVLVGTSLWAGSIANELEEQETASINMATSFDPATSQLQINTTILPLSGYASSTGYRFTLMLTESGIVDRQLTPTGWDDNYVHKHVLRDIITDYRGDVIAEPLIDGQPITRTHTFTLPTDWDPAKCELVGFLSRDIGTDRRVIQVEAKHFYE
jgi:hypothetical protein